MLKIALVINFALAHRVLSATATNLKRKGGMNSIVITSNRATEV